MHRAVLIVASTLAGTWLMASLAWDHGDDGLMQAAAGATGGFLLALLALRLTREAPRT